MHEESVGPLESERDLLWPGQIGLECVDAG
jgi:hypothetical protein